ncbi:MAG: GHMP kinase [Chloroflexota bacterium]
MEIIKRRVNARAGLLGNPSDGYNGKTISFSIGNFWSEVVVYEWPTVEIVLARHDRAKFRSVHDLAHDVQLHGYYGGIRLIKATVKRFVEYCDAQNITLHGRNFSIRYDSNIPRQVGLAGSSSIIIATLKCLMAFYDVEMPLEIQPSFALSIETDELGIAAGLQDRVIQVYGGMVYMDFNVEQQREIHGMVGYHYERLSPPADLPLYVAYHTDFSEPTENFHNDIRGRYRRGEEAVINAMSHFAELARLGRDAILSNDVSRLSKIIDENFDTRQSIAQLPHWQVQMVETARACGASAKFAGSGGAIVGVYENERIYNRLEDEMAKIGSKVLKPVLATGSE